MAKPTPEKRVTKSRRRASPASRKRATPARKKRTSASTSKRKAPTIRKKVISAKKQKEVSAVQPRSIPTETRERFPSFQPRFPERIFDKRPMRMPRRPAAARFEPGHRTGAKKRLGRTG